MFDIGFWELTIIAVVLLIVVGPDRLPGVARTAGKWFGKVSGFVRTIKADIDKEIHAEELKEVMAKQQEALGLDGSLHDIVEDTVKDAQADIGDAVTEASEAVASIDDSDGYSDRIEK